MAICTNFFDGSISSFAVNQSDGSLGPANKKDHNGSMDATPGPIADRQEGAHPHDVKVGPGGVIYIPDLGADKMFLYEAKQDGSAGMQEVNLYKSAAGAGPRSIVFHPILPLGYLLSELDSSLATLKVDADGAMPICQELHDTYPPPNGGAAPTSDSLQQWPDRWASAMGVSSCKCIPGPSQP